MNFDFLKGLYVTNYFIRLWNFLIQTLNILASPAVINSNEICEIITEKYMPHSDVFEDLVIVKEKDRKK